MADNDSTPGLWQDDDCVFVLAHITHCSWRSATGGFVSKDTASELHVSFISGKTISVGIKSGESLIRALNLYWETRTTTPSPSETRLRT